MRALITGASKGIGSAIAKQLAQRGYDLVICARDEQLLNTLAAEIRQTYGVKVDILPIDLALEDADQQLLRQLEAAALDIDCLVNNVGLGYLGDFTNMSTNRLQAMLNLNINLLTKLTHHFCKTWVGAGVQGKVLQVASLSAFQPGPWMAVYYASKAYVLNLSQALNYELRQQGITITTLCPGPTQTEFLHTAKMDQSALARGFIGMMTADQVAAIGVKALFKGRAYVVPGLFNKILGLTARLGPTRLSLLIVSLLHKMSGKKA